MKNENKYWYIALLFLGLVLSIMDVLSYNFKESGLIYSLYLGIVIFNFSYSPAKLSYINELNKSFKYKMNLFRLICFLEYVPMVVLIVSSTGIYSKLPFEKVISWISSFIGILIFFLIYYVLSVDDAKDAFNN